MGLADFGLRDDDTCLSHSVRHLLLVAVLSPLII